MRKIPLVLLVGAVPFLFGCNGPGAQKGGKVLAVISAEDTRADYGERRIRMLGPIDGRLHVAVITLRSDRVRVISHNFGYGVGDDMDSLLARHRRA